MSAIFLDWLFLVVFFIFISKSVLLMPMLIILEVMSLLVFTKLMMMFNVGVHSFMILVFLVIAASEAVLGLVLFVSFVRSFGKDYIEVMHANKF